MPRYPKHVTMDHVGRAFQELQITEAYNPGSFVARVVGNRLEFHLLGGRILYWPPDPKPKKPTRAKKPKEEGDDW